MNSRPDKAGGRQIAEWSAGLLLLAYAFVLFVHTAPPSLTDYANWTYQGILLARHLAGLPDPDHLLKFYPVPNSAATVAIALFSLLLPWKLAAKLWLSTQLAISFVSLRCFVRAAGASPLVWLIVPQAVFLNVNFWYGFMNFELGICWVFLVASLLLRRVHVPEGSFASDCWIGLLLLATYFTHMIPLAFCGLLVLLYARQSRRWRMLWQLAPSVVLTAWYVVGRFLLARNADGQTGMVGSVRNYSGTFWLYKVNSYLKSFGFINPNTPDGAGSAAISILGRPLFAVALSLSLVLCLAVAWCAARSLIRSYRDRSPNRFLWTGILLLLPLYLLAPATALGISDPGSRLLQVALALGLVMASIDRTSALRWSAGCATLLAILGIVLFARAGFGQRIDAARSAPIPTPLAQLAHVPNQDQDSFYAALDRGDYSRIVFPTGVFLNRPTHTHKSPGL